MTHPICRYYRYSEDKFTRRRRRSFFGGCWRRVHDADGLAGTLVADVDARDQQTRTRDQLCDPRLDLSAERASEFAKPHAVLQVRLKPDTTYEIRGCERALGT